MKTFIVLLAALFCSATHAQISFENEIRDSNSFFSLVQIDSGEYYYVTQILSTSTPVHDIDLKLYDLDFNLVKTLDVPIKYLSSIFHGDVVSYISKKLFDLDDSIEFLFVRDYGNINSGVIMVIKESGTILFACDTCSLGPDRSYDPEMGIFNTPKGTKMLVRHSPQDGNPLFLSNSVYSLPGKLLSHSSVDDISYIQSALDIETMPNPASDRIQINYHLPAGTLSGYIAIRDTKGAELQTHPINYTEGSISIDVRDLSPGSYYCCLLTSDGRTTVKKMMVVR